MREIVEYDTRNCPFCSEAVLGKWLANCSLPIGRKITLIDRFSGDPRNVFLKKLEDFYGGVYVLPTFLLIKDKATSTVVSVLDCFHLKTFLKEQEDII